MTQPQTETQPTAERSTAGSINILLLVVVTVTALVARWADFIAIPYVVIFAPLLTVVGIFVLAGVLAIIAAIATAGRNG